VRQQTARRTTCDQGFGGSVMAYRLAEDGLRVCLVEMGKAYPPGSFPHSPYRMRILGRLPAQPAEDAKQRVRASGELQRAE
jgi:choline dehydrogenase-like flavoprotein